jgi:hypothetical protein
VKDWYFAVVSAYEEEKVVSGTAGIAKINSQP